MLLHQPEPVVMLRLMKEHWTKLTMSIHNKLNFKTVTTRGGGCPKASPGCTWYSRNTDQAWISDTPWWRLGWWRSTERGWPSTANWISRLLPQGAVDLQRRSRRATWLQPFPSLIWSNPKFWSWVLISYVLYQKVIKRGTELVFEGRRSKEGIFDSRAVMRLLSTALWWIVEGWRLSLTCRPALKREN